jgi:putative transposase
MAGGTYFFTLNVLQRYPNDLLLRPIELLRTGVGDVRARWPFHIDAWVVLPDHRHGGWTLPPDDADFTNRGRLIKQRFSKGLSNGERRSSVRIARGERGIWQRRFWEHTIRDDVDYAAHVDYCHINPVKHGFVQRAVEGPYSTFHRYVERGIYSLDGACGPEFEVQGGESG